MTAAYLKALAIETLRSPPAAARRILDMRLETPVLWILLVLVTVLNAVQAFLTNALFPSPGPIAGLVGNPLLYAIASGGGLVIVVFLLTWVGNILEGKGTLAGLLSVMIWAQFLGIVGQFIVIFLALAVPPLAGLAAMGLFGVTLWITLHFLSVAHGFDSLLKALGVLILSVLGLAFGLALVLMLVGVSATGVPTNV